MTKITAHNVGDRTLYVTDTEAEAIELVRGALDATLHAATCSPWATLDDLDEDIWQLFEDLTVIEWGDLEYLVDGVTEAYQHEVG